MRCFNIFLNNIRININISYNDTLNNISDFLKSLFCCGIGAPIAMATAF